MGDFATVLRGRIIDMASTGLVGDEHREGVLARMRGRSIHVMEPRWILPLCWDLRSTYKHCLAISEEALEH